MESALAKAIEIAGGQSALAVAIGTKQQNVWWWLNRKRAVPAEFVLPIERATSGRVSRHELRPDLYPSEPEVAA